MPREEIGRLLLTFAFGLCVLASIVFRVLAAREVEAADPQRGLLHAIAFRWHEARTPRARSYRKASLTLTVTFCVVAGLYVFTFR